jgi:isoleucyl-tRNA synthetase
VDSPERIAYRQVLDILFERLIRFAAPVIVFTAEEVWQSRYPEGESIHLEMISETPSEWQDVRISEKMQPLLFARSQILEAIEPLRREKVVGSSLQAAVTFPLAETAKTFKCPPIDPEALAELAIVASVSEGDAVQITPTTDAKCGRCWRHLPDVAEEGALCGRCDEVVNG